MRILLSVLAILFGAFIVVYGGIDDSPGGQLLGVVIAIAGFVGMMKSSKRNSILFLKALVILIGVAALFWLIWFPQIEGRNVNADQVTIYFRDPFLAYAYLASIPFFIGLYQGYKLLGYIEEKASSKKSFRSLRIIRFCAIASIGFIIGGEVLLNLGTTEDRAGIVAMGIYSTLACTAVAVAATLFEKRLQRA